MASGEAASFHGMIGRSVPMQALFERIERVAPLDVPVLILGETGTGKELVARAIQRNRPRRDRPFEVVNCGALLRDLLLSELFGHEKGAFTGAVTRKDGRLALADGGTVFLDEVGDLPLDAQVMLLRFLQFGEIQPAGSTKTKRVDVRVIAATHRELEWAIERGHFRGDLYYRLCDMVIEVPPLRARREDIPLLVEHIRVQTNTRCSLAIEGVSPEVLGRIENLPWAGNVRELEATVRRAMIVRGEGWVRLEDLQLGPARSMRTATTNGSSVAMAEVRPGPALTWLGREALRLAEERHEISRGDLMTRCGVSRELARRQLGGLVSAGLLRRVGKGRGVRYAPAALAPIHDRGAPTGADP